MQAFAATSLLSPGLRCSRNQSGSVGSFNSIKWLDLSSHLITQASSRLMPRLTREPICHYLMMVSRRVQPCKRARSVADQVNLLYKPCGCSPVGRLLHKYQELYHEIQS